MKKALAILVLIILVNPAYPQQSSTSSTQVDISYFVTHTRDELIQKLVDLPLGIRSTDPIDVIMNKIETYLFAFVPQTEYADDEYAKAANLQALKSVKK
jgi:hypothetical protein